ncbi:MAG: spoIIIJ-associated protein [Thermoleophilaceae bacterium]|nr:spoIIIJ-associated protein [Thermoleophilaceae bacterium]
MAAMEDASSDLTTGPDEIGDDLPDTPVERVRAVVTKVVRQMGIDEQIDVEETDEEIRVLVHGEDVGLLIGKHGSTIDALQHLAVRIAYGGTGDRKSVVVDAAGYRERREQALRRAADQAVADALRFGRAVELEPMGAFERRTVHMYLRDSTEVETHSEGDEPERRLVVTPVRGQSE